MKYFNVAIRNQNQDLEAYVVRAETSGKALLKAKAEWDRTHSFMDQVSYQWALMSGPDDTTLVNDCAVVKRLVNTDKPVQKESKPSQDPQASSGMFFHVDGKEIELSLEPIAGNN